MEVPEQILLKDGYGNTIKGPTTNLYKLVISRLLGVMSVFCSSILLTMCILFRPWKVESYAGKNAEFSIWKVCRADKKKEKCFPGYYEKNAHAWFFAMRYLLLIGIILQFTATLYLLVMITFTRNKVRKNFRFGAIAAILSAACILTALIIFLGYRRFDFAMVTFKYQIMGWTEERQWSNAFGYPYIMTWVALAMSICSSIICLVADKYDVMYVSGTLY